MNRTLSVHLAAAKPAKLIFKQVNHRLATGSSNRTHLQNLTPKFLNDSELGHSEINRLGAAAKTTRSDSTCRFLNLDQSNKINHKFN